MNHIPGEIYCADRGISQFVSDVHQLLTFPFENRTPSMLRPARELRNYLLSAIDNSSLVNHEHRINIRYYEIVTRRNSNRHTPAAAGYSLRRRRGRVKKRKRCGRDLNLVVDGAGPLSRPSTACVCPLIMAGKAAAAWDRDVPRPNCYIYAKRGWGRTRSVSVGYAGTHGVIKPSGPLWSTSVTGKRSVGPEYPVYSKNSTRRRIQVAARAENSL
jgi:hypothetical protein